MVKISDDRAPAPIDGRPSALARWRTRLGDRAFLAASTIMRMGAGLAVFMLLARGLGPVQFGLFSTVFSYALIASFITDFGYSVRALRDIAHRPDQGGAILAQALGVKLLLTAAVLLVGGAIILVLPLDPPTKLACALIGFGVLMASIGDLSLVAFRAVGRYAGETWIVAWTSGLYAVLLGALAWGHASVLVVGAGFFVARAVYAVISTRAARKLLGRAPLRIADAMQGLRTSVSWAADSGMGFVSGQIDGLFVAHFLGLGAAGIYQSGARFVQAALGFAGILSNIHIPRLAAKRGRDTRREWVMTAEFVLLGAVFGVGLVLVGPYLTRWLLGSAYSDVDQLWLGLAVFIVARYAAAAFGAALSAKARPGLRVFGQAVGLIAVVAGLSVFLPREGIAATPWVMAIGAFLTAAVYAIGTRINPRSGGADVAD